MTKNIDISRFVTETTLEEIKNMYDMERWIPVSERLPEEKVEVLATTEWGSVTIAERYSANDYFINDGATNADEDEIIAWMPLPEPYKADNRTEQGLAYADQDTMMPAT